MADLAPAARGKLRRVALCDIEPHPSDRPRREGAHTWRAAFDVLTLDAEALSTIVAPFEVADIAATLAVDDDCALFMEAPAVREATDAEGRHFGIFGERRLWAALLCGATHASVKVYDVGPEEAALMHYRENACRVDLPPLADAAELARLRDEHGLDVAAIAARTGRTVDHVKGRLLLLSAIAPIRAAFAAGEVVAEVVRFFARRSAEEQLDAWERSAHYRRASEVLRLTPAVRALFAVLPLHAAPWPLTARARLRPGTGEPGDLELLPACHGCPKRSDAQGALFTDDAAAECLDAKCWDRKAESWSDNIIEAAEAKRVPVLRGDDARRILPAYASTVDAAASGYVDLDAASPLLDGHGKPLTWRLVLPSTSRDAEGGPLGVDAVLVDGAGKARELVKVERAVPLAKKKIAEEAAAHLRDPSPEADAASDVVAAQRKTIDTWAAAIAASRTEVREPPAPVPLPKAKAPGKADERAAGKAKADVEAQGRILRAVHTRAANAPQLDTEAVARWLLVALSSDAICLAAEAIEPDGEGEPAEVLAGIIDGGEHADIEGVLVTALAAELLTRGGELAELPGRWAGKAAPKAPAPAKKKASKSAVESAATGKAKASKSKAANVPAESAAPSLPVEKAACPLDWPGVQALAKRCGFEPHDGAHAPGNVWKCIETIRVIPEPSATREAIYALDRNAGTGSFDCAILYLCDAGELTLTKKGKKPGADVFERAPAGPGSDALGDSAPLPPTVQLEGEARKAAEARPCPTCKAKPGKGCVALRGKLGTGWFHRARVEAPAVEHGAVDDELRAAIGAFVLAHLAPVAGALPLVTPERLRTAIDARFGGEPSFEGAAADRLVTEVLIELYAADKGRIELAAGSYRLATPAQTTVPGSGRGAEAQAAVDAARKNLLTACAKPRTEAQALAACKGQGKAAGAAALAELLAEGLLELRAGKVLATVKS